MSKKELPLREFWHELGFNGKDYKQSLRAPRMEQVCQLAELNHQGVKAVINRHRRLSIDAAKRLRQASIVWATRNKFDYIISMSDLYEICGQEIKDKRKR